jgi:hypothetical protein
MQWDYRLRGFGYARAGNGSAKADPCRAASVPGVAGKLRKLG